MPQSSLNPRTGARLRQIINHAILANVETSVALPPITRKFMLQQRERAVVRVAFIPGDTAHNYFTVPVGSAYWEDGLYSELTVYLQSDVSGTIEIICWF